MIVTSSSFVPVLGLIWDEFYKTSYKSLKIILKDILYFHFWGFWMKIAVKPITDKLYVTGQTFGLPYKSFTIIIFDRNDSTIIWPLL